MLALDTRFEEDIACSPWRHLSAQTGLGGNRLAPTVIALRWEGDASHRPPPSFKVERLNRDAGRNDEPPRRAAGGGLS